MAEDAMELLKAGMVRAGHCSGLMRLSEIISFVYMAVMVHAGFPTLFSRTEEQNHHVLQ